LLKTIFTYVEPNSELAIKIRNNFLLVEYEEGSDNELTTEHDIDMAGFSTIRINRIKTDNFQAIYKALAKIHLPITAMDVRKVQSVVSEIYSGGKIEVNITEDLDSLKNGDKILAIGSSKTISYQFQTASEMMANYFKIMEESNNQILVLIDKYQIQSTQYFPIFGFSSINSAIKSTDRLKEQQRTNLTKALDGIKERFRIAHNTIPDIMDDSSITVSTKNSNIFYNVMNGNLSQDEVEEYLKNMEKKHETDYRRILCAYDLKKYDLPED